MCATCGWLELAAAITANLETRDRAKHTTCILEVARDQIVQREHVSDQMRDAVEGLAEKEGWQAV